LTDTVQRVAFPVIGQPREERTTAADVRGHAAGYAAGLRAAEAETAALRARLLAEHEAAVASLRAEAARRVAVLDTATTALLSRVTPVLADAEESLVRAALDLAEAVVGSAIRAGRRDDAPAPHAPVAPHASVPPQEPVRREARGGCGAEATVRRALATVDRTVAVAVRVSPADAERVADLDLSVPVLADPALRDGDAVVDLPDGLVDARIGAALDRARAALEGVR